MKKCVVAALVGVCGWMVLAAGEPLTPFGRYVVAVEAETAKDAGWQKVVAALRMKYRATVLTYVPGELDALLPALRKAAPRYVCFVTKPEHAGRDLIVGAAQTLRKIDDDPYGDALWGVVTGYEAADALRIVSNPKPMAIKQIATSMGNPDCLNDWEGGFASNEANRNEFWTKKPGGTTVAERVEPDPAEALAKAFNQIPIDYWMTSGHASERDWQIIYNQNAGSLKHKDGELFFVSPSGGRYPMASKNPKVYIAAGNCLIGNIDKPDCMATAWMHTGGVSQMLGYTVPTFYGFMGWGTKSLFECGRHSVAEAYFLNNQILLWTLGQVNGGLRDEPLDPKGPFDVRDILRKLAGKVHSQDELGLIWDRDTVAFYGDPAWRVTYPEKRRDIAIDVVKNEISLRFLRDVTFPDKIDIKGTRPVGVLLNTPPPKNAKLVDAATGEPVPNAVVTELFALIPLTGKQEQGKRLRYVVK
ncbi:MAG: hypothetical protein J6334_13145 [Kiritimatiellae bacterium]|nr:hypothetical protein [Kiritimatiellia bacterium]